MNRPKAIISLRPCAVLLLSAGMYSCLADDTNLQQQVRWLQQQNLLLQEQLQKQGQQLDALSHKVTELQNGNGSSAGTAESGQAAGYNFGKVNISAEGGVAFFNTGSEGFAPHSEFRVDEARLFIEAPIRDNVYFYSDTDLATRENTDLRLYLNELYLDFEDISQLWGQDRQLNIRAGRLNIPFGEEYLARYAIDNPLISHSVSDFWGVDPGIELYGAAGRVSYVVAVQNGGISGVQDFTGDKSIAGRLSYDPIPWLHTSVSAMRTGDLSVPEDMLSAIWFGNGFFHSLGSSATTRFHANLVEGDIAAHWKTGHVSAFGGLVHYGDNDPATDNGRNAFYYSVEGVQQLPKKFYAAARFSQILAGHGIPIVGQGDFNSYFGELTTELWRVSLGLGYRFSDRLILKAEYSFENGRELGGGSRNQEDFFGTEAAFKF